MQLIEILTSCVGVPSLQPFLVFNRLTCNELHGNCPALQIIEIKEF